MCVCCDIWHIKAGAQQQLFFAAKRGWWQVLALKPRGVRLARALELVSGFKGLLLEPARLCALASLRVAGAWCQVKCLFAADKGLCSSLPKR